jgi:hypothetical protein
MFRMTHREIEPLSIGVFDFVSRWRPNCLCWTCEPLFHG